MDGVKAGRQRRARAVRRGRLRLRLKLRVWVASRQRSAAPVTCRRGRQLLELDGVVALRDRLALAIAASSCRLRLPLLAGNARAVRSADAVGRAAAGRGLPFGAHAGGHGVALALASVTLPVLGGAGRRAARLAALRLEEARLACLALLEAPARLELATLTRLARALSGSVLEPACEARAAASAGVTRRGKLTSGALGALRRARALRFMGSEELESQKSFFCRQLR